MFEKINVNGIELERFSNKSKEHLKLAKYLKNDLLINEFFSEWESITNLSLNDDSNTFYSYVIKDIDLMGITTICFISDYECVISYGLLDKFRGKGYSKLVREILINELSKLGVTTIKAYIKSNNVSSINDILKTGLSLSEVPNSDLLVVSFPVSRSRK